MALLATKKSHHRKGYSMSNLKERSIRFNAEMVRATLEGRKTQDRQVIIKSQFIYGLTDDWIYGKLIVLNNEARDENANGKNPDISKRQLHGWIGWEYLLSNEIQRLWEEGVRGLVSVKRSQGKRGISYDFALSQQHKSDPINTSINLYGLSRNAEEDILSGKTFGWQPKEQQARKSMLGNTTGELAGSKGSRERERGGKTSDVKTLQQRMRTFEVGDRQWLMQPATGSASVGDVAGWNFIHCQFQAGMNLWVQETIKATPGYPGQWAITYAADGVGVGLYKEDRSVDNKPLRYGMSRQTIPSTQIPRWASRINLLVKDIRVERVQDISEEDVDMEGVFNKSGLHLADCHYQIYHPDQRCDCGDKFVQEEFAILWSSVNSKRGFSWDVNPFVWVIEFEVTP